MGKRGKKLDEKTEAEIIRLSKEYGPRYIAQHLGLHESTVRRHIEQELEAKVIASRSFYKHGNEVSSLLKQIVSNRELLDSSLAHFKQEYPEFAHLDSWQDISKEDIQKGILDKMELLANSRSFRFCAKCPVCQDIKRGLRKGA